MTSTSRETTALLFTRAEMVDRLLFRAVRVTLRLATGRGRLWLDIDRKNTFDLSFQRNLQELKRFGERGYDLPWGDFDLFFSSNATALSLAGASASLPIFVSLIALLARAPLPEPLLAAGVAAGDSGALLPASRQNIQGKIELGDEYVRQVFGPDKRLPMWIPAGSDADTSALTSVEVREASSLTEAVERILGLRAQAPQTQSAPRLASDGRP